MASLTPADLNFEAATPIISNAMKFVLPIPADRGERLVYPETVTDVKGTVHAKGSPITTWDGKPLPGDGVVVYNSSEKIYQGAVRGQQGDSRSVIIINHVNEEQAAALNTRLNTITGNKPESITLEQFKAIEGEARKMGLTNMYDSNVGFVQKNMQDVYTGKPAETPYGFMKRDGRDRVLAVRMNEAGELARPGQQPLPYAAGSVVLKHGDDYRVITPADLEKTYRHADNFKPVQAEIVAPAQMRMNKAELVATPVTAPVKEDTNWMVTGSDKEAVAKRSLALANEQNITGTPNKAAHNLGSITLADGRTVTAHVVHAVDPVITDGKDVVMINRAKPPGQGLPALPGGFIDPKLGGTENAVQAAAREALEEAGIKVSNGTPVGQRNMYRPNDVRTATADMPLYGIKKGDVFMVSTQAVRFDVPDLAKTNLLAGDDAMPGSARRVSIESLSRDKVGIPDHFDMIKQTHAEVKLANTSNTKTRTGVEPSRPQARSNPGMTSEAPHLPTPVEKGASLASKVKASRYGILGPFIGGTTAAVTTLLVGSDPKGVGEAFWEGAKSGTPFVGAADQFHKGNRAEGVMRGAEDTLNSIIPFTGTLYGEVVRPLHNISAILAPSLVPERVNDSIGVNLVKTAANLAGAAVNKVGEMAKPAQPPAAPPAPKP